MGKWFDKNKIWRKYWTEDYNYSVDYQNGFGSITNYVAQGIVIAYLIGLAVMFIKELIG